MRIRHLLYPIFSKLKKKFKNLSKKLSNINKVDLVAMLNKYNRIKYLPMIIRNNLNISSSNC